MRRRQEAFLCRFLHYCRREILAAYARPCQEAAKIVSVSARETLRIERYYYDI